MKIGFIGCGNMGSAMISGILKKGIFQKNEIIVSNLTEEGSKRSREKLGVVTTLDNRQVVKNAKMIVLAVKPQFYQEVIEEVRAQSYSRAYGDRYCTREKSGLDTGNMSDIPESSTPYAKYPGSGR